MATYSAECGGVFCTHRAARLVKSKPPAFPHSSRSSIAKPSVYCHFLPAPIQAANIVHSRQLSIKMSDLTTHVGFVPNPKCGRGTISLLLQCVSTIFLCVYTSLHLDVPLTTLTAWKSVLRKAVSVAICVIAPEAFTLMALTQCLDPSLLCTLLRSKLGSIISKKRAYCLLDSGIHISTEDGRRELKVSELIKFPGHFCLDKIDQSQCRRFWESVIAKLPSDFDLDDKSKSSSIGKVLTCLQAGKTLALIFGRFAKRFDVSLLEIATVAYITLTLLSYVFWFSKPYDIQTYQNMSHVDIPERNDNNSTYTNLLNASTESPRAWLYPFSFETLAVDTQSRRKVVMARRVAFVLLGSIFASIHCTAWNYQFPSTAEAFLWKASCISIAVIPWSIAALVLLYRAYWDRMGLLIGIYFCAMMLLYVIARLILIVQMFTSFRSAPRGV